MAAPQVIIAKAVISMAASDDGKTLRRILTSIAAVFLAVLVLLSAVLDILSSPSDYDGAAGLLKEQFGFLVQSAPGVGNEGILIDEDIENATAFIADQKRRAIIQTGLTLVGKVPYFWGGKSNSGWNDQWGKKMKITSPGSSRTGTYQPYGLDCSGFVSWTLSTSGFWDIKTARRYEGTSGLWSITKSISESDLLPGDLGFLRKPGNGSTANHVGFFYGYDAKGRKIWLHCSSGGGGVVLNTFNGFKYYKRLTEVQP